MMLNEAAIAEIDAGPLTNDRLSIFLHIEQGLRQGPHKPAVICMHQPSDHLSALMAVDDSVDLQIDTYPGCLVLTYAQLHGAAVAAVAGMMALGVRPGTRILTLIPNGGEYAVLLWACALLRLTLTSVDPSTLVGTGKAELRDLIVRDLQPGIIVVLNGSAALVVDELIERDAPQRLRVSLMGEKSTLPDLWVSFAFLVSHGQSLRFSFDEASLLEAARRDDPDRIHSIMFTSGTSNGRSKGCPQRVASTTHMFEHLSWLFTRDASTAVLQQAHNSRAIAPLHTLQAWGQGGAVVMARDSFAIKDTLAAILHHSVTYIVVSPAMVHALAQDPLGTKAGKHSVQVVHLGGDTITKDVLVKCTSLFPHARICLSHGMTEGLGFFQWPFERTKPVAEISLFGEVCPTGVVAAGSRLRIWDMNQRAVASRGQPGELHVSCDSVIRRYLNSESRSSFYEDETGRQWFVTGDMAMMDRDGLVFILGRRKDLLERAGMIIMPAVLESCIQTFTGRQAVVVAVPHLALSQESVVVLDELDGKNEDEIRAHVVGALGLGYDLARVLTLRQIGLSRFPVNATHKILRFEVQRMVEEHLHRVESCWR